MSKDKYVGLDVHKATIVIAVLNAVGQMVMQTIIATDTQVIREFFKGLSGTVSVALEEGTQSAWLYALLRPLVKDVVVCNPRHNKLIETGNKSDQIDAEKLAQLLRLGSLKVVYKGNQEQRQLKDLARAYQNLVSDSTRVMNRIKAIYRARGINCDGHNIYKPDQRQLWLDRLQEQGARFRARMLFEQLEKLTELRQAAKQEFLHQGKRQPEYSILCGLPGIGPLRASVLLAFVGTPHRFRTKRQFWPYCGLSVITRTSADHQIVNGTISKRHKVIATRGLNPMHVPELKQVFKDAAITAARQEPCQSWYQARIDQGMRPEMARLSLARRLAAVTLTLWQRKEKFEADKFSTLC
ncbi:MAG: IS110 family transposase [Blastocatellia bacterium]